MAQAYLLRCFETRDKDLLVRTFIAYVRSLVEYNSVVWSPHLKKDIETVEKVQRRFPVYAHCRMPRG